jgi:hypothetical protein
MKYFDSQDSTHRLTFISRKEVESIDLIIYDKYNDVWSLIENIPTYCKNGYLTCTFAFEFKQGFTYMLRVENNDNLLFQDLCKIN